MHLVVLICKCITCMCMELQASYQLSQLCEPNSNNLINQPNKSPNALSKHAIKSINKMDERISSKENSLQVRVSIGRIKSSLG